MAEVMLTTGIMNKLSFQKSFYEDCCSLVATFEELGNPFLAHSKDLVTLDYQEIISDAMVQTVSQIRLKGDELYKTFMEQKLMKMTLQSVERF